MKIHTYVSRLCETDIGDILQVTASVLRNLSWRADGASKQTLREVGAVSGLMHAAMEGKKESTLKSILSALWNLSAHCSINKVGRNLTIECLSEGLTCHFSSGWERIGTSFPVYTSRKEKRLICKKLLRNIICSWPLC